MKMMHRARPLVALLALTVGTAGCHDEYEELFLNPERSTTAEVPFLFTQSLISANFHVDYWEAYYRIYRNMSRWGQLTGTQNDDLMMNQNPGQWDAYWRWYYTEKAMFIQEMDVVRARMPETTRDRVNVFIELGKIVHAYNTHQITDVWGDIPYSEAFTARDPSVQNLFPKFDSQESVYDAMLADLKSASDALRSGTLHNHAQLARQDVFLGGNLLAWQRFANSLRLRLAMRLSEVAPEKSRQIVQEILTSGHYPVVESNAENIVWQTLPNTGGDDRGRPTRESQQEVFAPKVMMDLMNGAADPRIPVYFAPNAAGQYVGLPSSPDAQATAGTVNRTNFAHLNPVLWENHPTYPGFVITAAEVSFLKAEAHQRGWVPGDAAAAHAKALRESVAMYYNLYNGNPNASTPLPVPSAAVLDAFATGSAAAFNGTLQRIAEQKWIHLGFNQPYEAWAEQRRTGAPVLPVDTFGGTALPRTVRIMYPSTEQTNNRQNWQAVQAKDTPTSKVWWHVR
jgi:hypothetical protein